MKVRLARFRKKKIYFKDIFRDHFIYGTQGPTNVYWDTDDSRIIIDVRNFGITYLHEGNYAYWTYSRVYSLEEQ